MIGRKRWNDDVDRKGGDMYLKISWENKITGQGGKVRKRRQ
jgi:hypothetical protein